MKIKFISDLHIGTRFCRYDLVKEAFKGDDPIMLGGDLGDWISPNDPRYDEDCIMSIDEQHTYLMKLLKGKNIISMIDGNHEISIARHTGFNMCRSLSENLGIPYNGPNTYTNVNGVSVYNYHGTGGGSFIGTILQKLEKVPMRRGAKVYVQGHSHQLFTVPVIVEIGEDNVLNWLINSGSFMEDATYARSKNLPPSVLGYAVYDTVKDYAYPVLLGNNTGDVCDISKNELTKYYKNHSLKETTGHFGCSERTITRRLKKFGISKRK